MLLNARANLCLLPELQTWEFLLEIGTFGLFFQGHGMVGASSALRALGTTVIHFFLLFKLEILLPAAFPLLFTARAASFIVFFDNN